MPIDAGTLVINDRYWLGMTRHETVIERPDEHIGNPTWHAGDRAWNRFVNPFAPAGVGTGAYGTEGWICTGGTYFKADDQLHLHPLRLEGGTLGKYNEGRTATADGTAAVVLNEPSSVLKPAMYLVINDTPSFIVSISGVTLTMNDTIPAGGPGLRVDYNPPDFHKFGSIALTPDPPPSSPPSPADFPRVNLVAPAKAGAGARGCVSDATTTVFGAVVVGGGQISCLPIATGRIGELDNSRSASVR